MQNLGPQELSDQAEREIRASKDSLQQISGEDMKILREEQKKQEEILGYRPYYKQLISDAIQNLYGLNIERIVL